MPVRLCLLLLILPMFGCSHQDEVRDTRFMMGTLVEFTVADIDRDTAGKAIAAAAHEMQRVDSEFTIYGDRDNPVKRFNAAPVGNPVALPEEIGRLIDESLKVQQQSGDNFDPFLGGLNMLWGFSSGDFRKRPPEQEEIAARIPPRLCTRHQPAGWVREDARCLLDFGAIAKGYAIDRGIAVLKAHGIRDAIINAGGDIRVIGSHGGKPWRIGIRDPRKPGAVIGRLDLSGDVSVVSSGDYERFFIYEGKRYHHILDPATGWPATGAQSATVIAPDATLADAWSTALFVAGASGMKMMDAHGLSALLVDAQGRMAMNDGMRHIFRPEPH